ncbi:MAG: BamA/TamA family outer membrane protein [Gemmatimonas sp.]|nr:BamA/TamA family outer membrane protein [Gemmatimonas sp.]
MEQPISGRPRVVHFTLLALLAIVGIPQGLDAQYFGRNQVQYRTFDFQILETENFDIYFYPEEEQGALDIGRMSERWYARLSRILDHTFEDRQPVIMYATHPHFQQTNILGGGISEGTGGVTEAFKQRVVLPFAYSYEETDHVLGHELVHAFQYDISGLGRAGGGIEAAAQRFQVPLWFIEGMAEYLAVGPVDPHTAMWLRDGALRGDLPDIDRMTRDPSVFPYRWGQALWAYIGGTWGDLAIGQILKLTGQGVPYEAAFQRILNISMEELSADWHASIRRAYLPMLADRPEAREVAEPLLTGETEGGRMNVAPVLSPDGRYLVFLSELDFIEVQLHLADAETGEVIRTLQEGAAFDPHFGSLRYIASAGTWSPDSRQFALSALRGGKDVIVILDVDRARRVREISIPDVDEISNPTWSPDGRTIAFTGLVGGISDLFVVDLETGESTQLTDDRYAELHPAYSPDGSQIAFSTDRGEETDFDELKYGPYGIGIMDVETREVTLTPRMEGTKNINPQWTSDGEGIYFISDRTGIPNIYLLDLNDEKLSQVTDLFIGVSGITDVSPALTVAGDGSRLAFTEFQEAGFNIYALSDAEDMAGTEVPAPTPMMGGDTVPPAAVLPPVPRPEEPAFNRVTLMLDDPVEGLPTPAEVAQFAIAPYRPSLGLDYLGQPQVGVSVGGGAFNSGGLYGGIFGIFSDILGRHQVFGAVQAQGQIDEVGFALQYLNMRERWNFGAAAQRVPLVYGRYTPYREAGTENFVQSIERIRVFDTSLQGFTQYPFSQVRRAELSAGLRRVSQDAQIFETVFDPTGQVPLEQRERRVDGLSLNIFEASAAYVYDSSLLGYTSPFAGQRYRFQITPTFGELQFVQGLADYRRYFFLNPFTLAVRGMHVGRYGRDSEGIVDDQQVLADYYLGQAWYIRGYQDVYNRCRSDGEISSCELTSSLLGSRIGVVNAELRFPLIRQLVIGSSFGLPPIEGIIFGDAGVAWDRFTSPIFERGVPENQDERGILTSAGVGARVNLFGILILEVDYVNAFERDRGWHWQFGFVPGF